MAKNTTKEFTDTMERMTEEMQVACDEAEKLTTKGTKAAAPRVRKALQNVIAMAKEARKLAQEVKESL